MSNNLLQFIVGAVLILCVIFAPSIAAAITYVICGLVALAWLLVIYSLIERFIIKPLRRKYGRHQAKQTQSSL